jgi:hypothetical protein
MQSIGAHHNCFTLTEHQPFIQANFSILTGTQLCIAENFINIKIMMSADKCGEIKKQ